jgi:hypothetical protein
MANWDSAYEGLPEDSHNPQDGNEHFQEMKTNITDRMGLEHRWDPTGTATYGGASGQGWHLEGSAIAYYESAGPSNRPDGSTSFTALDTGRLWIDSDTGFLHYYNGSTWVGLTKFVTYVHIQGVLAVGNDLAPRIVFPTGVTITDVVIMVKTAPTDATLIIDLHYSDTDTTIFSTKPEITTGKVLGNLAVMDAGGTPPRNAVAADEYLDMDIDQVGSGTAGADLTIAIEARYESA